LHDLERRITHTHKTSRMALIRHSKSKFQSIVDNVAWGPVPKERSFTEFMFMRQPSNFMTMGTMRCLDMYIPDLHSRFLALERAAKHIFSIDSTVVRKFSTLVSLSAAINSVAEAERALIADAEGYDWSYLPNRQPPELSENDKRAVKSWTKWIEEIEYELLSLASLAKEINEKVTSSKRPLELDNAPTKRVALDDGPESTDKEV